MTPKPQVNTLDEKLISMFNDLTEEQFVVRMNALILEARIDTVKTIKENTEYALNNDTQVVAIFRDKDNKVTLITNSICQNYLAELKEQS